MNIILAIMIILIWFLFGFIGMYQYYYRKFAWGMIIFLCMAPFLAFLDFLLR